MSERNTSPADLLRRYRRNVFPPQLDPYQRAVAVHYLEEQGLEAKVGVVSGETRLPLHTLVELAKDEVNPASMDPEALVVGPNSAGLTDGISLYGPAAPAPETPEPR